MANLPPTILESLMKQIGLMPLWIRQVMYAQLKSDLEHTLSTGTLEAFTQEHMLQLWVPELTHDGIQMITSPSVDRNSPTMRLLQLSRFKKDVANITVMNTWSLEQCSIYLKDVIDKNLITKPNSGVVYATIDYLAGVTRLGEYLVKINRVTEEQLDQALRTQKYIEESMGERTGIANVMINLGYIKKEDTEGILFLKEESKKPFQMPNIQPSPAAAQPQTPQARPQQQSPAVQNWPQQGQQQAPRPPQPQPQQPPAPPPAAEQTPKKWGLF